MVPFIAFLGTFDYQLDSRVAQLTTQPYNSHSQWSLEICHLARVYRKNSRTTLQLCFCFCESTVPAPISQNSLHYSFFISSNMNQILTSKNTFKIPTQSLVLPAIRPRRYNLVKFNIFSLYIRRKFNPLFYKSVVFSGTVQLFICPALESIL